MTMLKSTIGLNAFMKDKMMTGLDEKKVNYAPAYVVGIYPGLVETAKKLGYALALHGSVARDLDLVAVPWTDEAAKPEELLKAICDTFDLETNNKMGLPDQRPHGRLSWSIPLWWGAYIDLSVYPPNAKADLPGAGDKSDVK
jgi:hypothetical protein